MSGVKGMLVCWVHGHNGCLLTGGLAVGQADLFWCELDWHVMMKFSWFADRFTASVKHPLSGRSFDLRSLQP